MLLGTVSSDTGVTSAALRLATWRGHIGRRIKIQQAVLHNYICSDDYVHEYSTGLYNLQALTQPAIPRPSNLLDGDLQFLTSSLRNSARNLVRAKRLNRIIRQRVRSQSSLRHRVSRTAQVNVIDNRVASVVGVGKEDGLVGAVGECRALDQDLRIHAAVDAV